MFWLLLLVICFLPSFVLCENDYCGKNEVCKVRNTINRILLLECPLTDGSVSMINDYLTVMELHEMYLITSDKIILTDRSQFNKYCNISTNKNVDVLLATVLGIKNILELTSDHLIEINVIISTVNGNINDNDLIDIIEMSNSDRHAYHFFMNSRYNAFGSTLDCVEYDDGTHYNKALTLSKLIKHGHANSLQAHLLAKGVYVTVNSIDNLLNFKYPSINDVFGIPYKDMCVGITCNNGEYCSVLHGCVSNNSVSNNCVINIADNNHVNLNQEQFTRSHDIQPRYNNWSNNSCILSIVQNSTKTISDIITDEVVTINWAVNKPFINKLINDNKPVLMKNTIVNKWNALKLWNIQYICDNIDTFVNVKCSNSYVTFDPDYTTPLKLNISVPYDIRNMTKETFCECLHFNKCGEYKGYYYFSKVPKTLSHDILPNDYLFHTEKDKTSQKQYIWISSKGMITHGHFDQDYNIFVQVVGEKRFTLWSPSQHELMYVYPRIHPMWHKSRINFASPNINTFPNFVHSKGIQIIVKPGDILYIPPYTWHYVETLSSSISLSTWSHDYHMYDHMNAIYGHDHKFDLIQSKKGTYPIMYYNSYYYYCYYCYYYCYLLGQMFALRMYLDLLIQDLYGYKETTKYFSKLLSLRFTGLHHLFAPSINNSLLCNELLLPTCQHVYGYVTLDVNIIGSHFKALKPHIMDILLMDYIEEITAQIVGVNMVLSFFRYCFQGQDYYLTEIGQPDHSLWN